MSLGRIASELTKGSKSDAGSRRFLANSTHQDNQNQARKGHSNGGYGRKDRYSAFTESADPDEGLNKMLESYGFNHADRSEIILAFGKEAVRQEIYGNRKSEQVTPQSFIGRLEQLAEEPPNDAAATVRESIGRARQYLHQRYILGKEIGRPPIEMVF